MSYNLELIAGWRGLRLCERSAEEEQVVIQPHLDYLKTIGCHLCVVYEVSNAIDTDRTKSIQQKPSISELDLLDFAAAVEQLAVYCASQDIALVYAKNVRRNIMRQMHEKGWSFQEGMRRRIFTVPSDPQGAINFTDLMKLTTKNISMVGSF